VGSNSVGSLIEGLKLGYLFKDVAAPLEIFIEMFNRRAADVG
jgi:hypothetical protein